MTRRHKDGLVSKVWNFQPIKEDEKRYIPFCTFQCHVGISIFYETCEKRKCNHYRKLYVELQNS